MNKFAFTIILNIISYLSIAQCDVVKKSDKFKNEDRFYNSGLNKISFTKWVENGKESIYLSIHSSGSTVSGGKGVFLLLKDGTKIIKNNEDVDVEVNDGDYYGGGSFEYSSFISLSKSDITKLLSSPITDFKLYIYDTELSEKEQNSNALLKCVIEAK